MSHHKIDTFHVIGIAVRTTNENGQSGQDIPELWNKFMSEGISAKIPGKLSDAVYCLYTDYEKDHTKPYTTVIGCKVKNLESIPDGMTGKTVSRGNYTLRIAKGDLMQGAVFKEWTEIWNSDLARSFTSDFEVYGEKAQQPGNAEVEIFLAMKS